MASTTEQVYTFQTTFEDWARSDAYHNSFLIPKDESLERALVNSEEQGLPEIAVSAAQGKFLKILAQSIGAKKIIEVGTLGGYVFQIAFFTATWEFGVNV